MSADEPAIDTEQLSDSDGGLLRTHVPAVCDVRRARAFHADGLGGRVATEEDPCSVGPANEWLVRAARFLTAPLDRGARIRCSMRDPDGYLVQVGQATGLVGGGLAQQNPTGRATGPPRGR